MTIGDAARLSPALAGLPLAFIDLETSGANFANDRIIEIGLLCVDGGQVSEWNVLVNPQRPLSSFIRHLTGIDDAMLAPAARFAELAPQLLAKLRGRVLVAHNARFDYGFLKAEFRRIGVDFVATTLCTVKLSRALFPEHHRHNLDTLLARFAIPIAGDRHRALADARALWDLWRCWRQRLPAERFAAAVAHVTGRPVCPPHLDAAVLDALPECAGAFAFYDGEQRLRLLKRAGNLRQQIFAQFTDAKRDSPLYQDTCRIDWHAAAGEFGARLGELALARNAANGAGHAPAGDGTRDADAGCCAWQLHVPRPTSEESADSPAVRNSALDYRPRLVFSSEIDFALADGLYGLYAQRRDALRALRRLAEAQALCLCWLGLEAAAAGGACAAYRQKNCRGVCIGKESPAQHGVRLLTSLAKFGVQRWPYRGAAIFSEQDDFGMHSDWHLIDRWRHLGTWHSRDELIDAAPDLLAKAPEPSSFDPEIYLLLRRSLRTPGKLRIEVLPAGAGDAASRSNPDR